MLDKTGQDIAVVHWNAAWDIVFEYGLTRPILKVVIRENQLIDVGKQFAQHLSSNSGSSFGFGFACHIAAQLEGIGGDEHSRPAKYYRTDGKAKSTAFDSASGSKQGRHARSPKSEHRITSGASKAPKSPSTQCIPKVRTQCSSKERFEFETKFAQQLFDDTPLHNNFRHHAINVFTTITPASSALEFGSIVEFEKGEAYAPYLVSLIKERYGYDYSEKGVLNWLTEIRKKYSALCGDIVV